MITKRERAGRRLLYGLIWTELGLMLVTHLGLLIASGEPGTLFMFLPMNAVTCGLLFLLAHVGQRELKWMLVCLQLARGGFQVFFYWQLTRACPEEHTYTGALDSKLVASLLGPTGMFYAGVVLICAVALAVSPSINAFLEVRRKRPKRWS
jgi:hypothetical protein